MAKHFQTIRLLNISLANEFFIVFDHFVRLTFKGLKIKLTEILIFLPTLAIRCTIFLSSTQIGQVLYRSLLTV